MHIDFSRLWRRGQGIKISISLTKIQEKAGAVLCQADFVVVLVVVVVGVIFVSNTTRVLRLCYGCGVFFLGL